MEEGEKALKQYEDFTDKEKLFVKYYPMRLNATWAAFKAGYSKDSCRQLGSETLSKPYIRAYIDDFFKNLQLGPDEVKKSISDIARASLNEFFVIKEVEYFPRVEAYVSVLAQKLRDEIEYVEGYLQREGIEKKARKPYLADQTKRRKQLIEYELILMNEGNEAIRFVSAPPIRKKVAELDLVKIATAYERGRIKSYSLTKDGPKIEMYPADGALRDLARMHGLFIDKTELTGKDGEKINLIQVEVIQSPHKISSKESDVDV